MWGTVVGAAMPLIMSAYVGVAERVVERVVELARPRSGRPETAPLLGAMLNRLTAARDAVRAMIDASDDLCFESSVEQASAVFSRKTNATEACLDVMRLALEAGGGASYGRAAGIEALVRDAHGALYHPLPAAQQQRFTGRVALGGAGSD